MSLTSSMEVTRLQKRHTSHKWENITVIPGKERILESLWPTMLRPEVGYIQGISTKEKRA